jgi:RNA polymerase sigma-70 factor (ECF subfamily)
LPGEAPDGAVIHLPPRDEKPKPDRPLAELSDDELMLCSRGGSAPAFDELVRRHQAAVIRVAHKFLGEPSLALDAAQCAFLELLHSLPRYEARGKFAAFLFRILVNQCKMLRRSSSRQQRSLDQLAVLESLRAAKHPESEIIARERRRDVQRALADLGKRTRSVLILRFAGGLSYKEIAEVLDVPIGTIKSRIAAGVEALRGLVHGERS